MEDYTGITDEQLAYLSGNDEKAQEFLLQKYKPLVRQRAGAYFLMGADREDLAQEGMLGLFKAIRDFNVEKSSFYAFAELCITRQMISAVKAATRQKHIPLNRAVSLQSTLPESEIPLEQMLVPKESNDPQEILLQRSQMAAMQETMQRVLSNLEKEVLRLYLSGMTYQQIAYALHRSEKSVDNALQRVKGKLEDFLP
jgi:RNA polymerase sporulation-specific sigma factor